MEKKEIVILTVLVIIVISIILVIYYFKNNENLDEKTMKCIASESLLIVSKTCSVCAYQKQILGDYYEYFKTIDVTNKPEAWEEYALEGVPTWIVNSKKYPGVQSIKKLKELTGC